MLWVVCLSGRHWLHTNVYVVDVAVIHLRTDWDWSCRYPHTYYGSLADSPLEFMLKLMLDFTVLRARFAST